MSQEHLQQVEALVQHAQSFLYQVQRNEAPDLEGFDQAHGEHFEQLKQLGPIDSKSPYAAQASMRMRYLDDLNSEMIKVIRKLLSDSRNQLSTTSTRKRGLTGYQRSLFGRSRGKGKWRGQG